MRRPRLPFWDNVDRSGGPEACWPWLGYKKDSGHGLTTLDSMPIHAHRKAWILTHGPIRGGLSALHKCDNPACCNPTIGTGHIYLGTRATNMIDRWTKRAADDRIECGRSRSLTDSQLQELWVMRRETQPAVPLKVCAEKFGVHIATICRYITEYRRAKLAQGRLARVSDFANRRV